MPTQEKTQELQLDFERRRFPRFTGPFSVRIDKRTDFARDINDEGVCISTRKPLAVGKRLTLRIPIPKVIDYYYEGLICVVPARVESVRNGARKNFDVVCRLEQPLRKAVEQRIAAHRRRVAVCLTIFVLISLWLRWSSRVYFWYHPIVSTYSWLISIYFFSRFVLALMHKSPPLKNYTPTITICIAVRNDEGAIGRAIDTCFDADYPDENRNVIVVDDGSTDGTPAVLAQRRSVYGDKLKVMRIPPAGKRHGMTAAVKVATGEIIVLVDSDTFLDKMALRHIVSGFEDRTLGAVSGHTDCENVEKNLLTRMQQMRYYVSFKLLKTSESLFGAVTCCPGCLSAYRREYLLEIIDEWFGQRFMGAPATFGDDRSLTNFILRKYRVIYNHQAICRTISPETWPHYLRQQVRWKKSWLRETLIASTFMWKKHPAAAISFYISAVVSLMSPFMAYRMIVLQIVNPDPAFTYYLLSLLTLGLYQAIYYLYRCSSFYWLSCLIMIASGVLVMGPQTYYAILTMRKNHWGTR